eukprot:363771-Chlamydomonas_euryale.AAC.10
MEGDAQKIQVLSHQNTRLVVQLDEARRESKVLEEKVSVYESKETEYAQTLLCVNRLWDQLHADVKHLCIEALGQAPDDYAAPDDKLKASDPFLTRLLHGDAGSPTAKSVAQGTKELHATLTDVEAALSRRSLAVKSVLSSVLDAVRTSGGHCMEAGNNHAEPAKAMAELRRQLDRAHAEARTARERMQLAEDRQLEAEEKMKAVQNELADAEQAISSMQRKVTALKAGQADGIARLDSMASGTPTAATAAAAHPSGGSFKEDPGMQSAVEKDLAEDMKQLQQLLDKRDAELEKEKEAHLHTKRCVCSGWSC